VDQTDLSEKLSRRQRLGLVCFGVALLGFGVLVVFRTAFCSRRMGDLDCFLRAAWAIRTGGDIYQVVDDNGIHYNYPPLFAILLAPLADPPAGVDRTGMLPYAVSAGLWYVLNLLFLALAVHGLACALEEPLAGQLAPGSRRWWALRLLPVLSCLPSTGHALMRGQSNLVVLLGLCAMMAALMRGRSARAGGWLALSICIKVYPAFLLLYPVLRRDWRFLGGCAAGLLVGLVLVPAAVLGPARTWDYAREYVAVTLAPGLGMGHDLSRSHELTQITSTDSQSLLGALHNSLHPRATRPADASSRLRLMALLLGGLLTATTFWAAGRRQPKGTGVPLLLGTLILNMLLLCPVCHLHYYCLAIPLVMGLIASTWESRPAPQLGRTLIAVLVANVVIYLLPTLPWLLVFRELGFAVYAGLLLWGAGVIVLRRRSRSAGPACLSAAVSGKAAA
jgi:alpha-1,2-mannosyltransferase